MYLGQRDEIDPGQKRLEIDYTSRPIEVSSHEYMYTDVGLSWWAPIQTSILMTSYPAGYEKSSKEPFCSINDELY